MLKSEVELRLVVDKHHNNSLGLIPSTYDLGRMYDNKSNRFNITSEDEIDLSEYMVFIRFISGNVDLGKVIVFPTEIESDDESENCITKWIYDIPMMYTMKDKLQVQLILDSSDGSEIRSNIVTFKLGNSLPQDKEFYQNLSYLNRLVCDNQIRLMVDDDKRELILLDDMEFELCRVDMDHMLPKEWW